MYAFNQVPYINMAQSTTGCCTLINPADWDEQAFTFNDKLFVKAKTRSLFHIPLNMGSVMKKAQAKIDEAGAQADDFIILSEEISPWRAEHYFAVSKEVPGLETARLSGTFMTKVFDGPFKDARMWYSQLLEYVKSRGMKPVRTFFFYTVCPKCAASYGKNYVVGFEQVSPK